MQIGGEGVDNLLMNVMCYHIGSYNYRCSHTHKPKNIKLSQMVNCLQTKTSTYSPTNSRNLSPKHEMKYTNKYVSQWTLHKNIKKPITTNLCVT